MIIDEDAAVKLPNDSTDLVSAYLDEELPEPDAKAFEDLLESSPKVQEELEDLRKMISLVNKLGDVEAPEDFYDKLSRRLRRRQLLQPQTSSKFTMIAITFQVLSIMVILTVAALYMMSELDAAPTSIERERVTPTTLDGTLPSAPKPVQP